VNTWLIIHFGLCALMTGLIWVVQLVHYPTFRFISEEVFQDFSLFHTTKITIIVMPAMLLELASALLLSVFIPIPLIWLNLVLNLSLFALTFFLSVPLHSKLAESKDKNSIEKLIKTNWPRTIIWTLRSVLLAYVLINGSPG
jgi:hypothetical protein